MKMIRYENVKNFLHNSKGKIVAAGTAIVSSVLPVSAAVDTTQIKHKIKLLLSY